LEFEIIMSRMVFVNLPVADVKRSIEFYSALGFEFDGRFTNDKAAGLIIEENHSYAMLLSHEYFETFITTKIADATKVTEALVAVMLESRAAVDEMVRKAVAAGGKDARPPKDHGFMYERAFSDPDGHIWEPFWWNPDAKPAQG
jgi:predicted lactoylglutathione lyase